MQTEIRIYGMIKGGILLYSLTSIYRVYDGFEGKFHSFKSQKNDLFKREKHFSQTVHFKHNDT